MLETQVLPPLSDAESADAVVDEVKDPSVVAIAKDGRIVRQIDDDELEAELILRYQAMAAKAFKQGKGGEREILTHHFITASQWLMMQLFTVDHQPLKIDHLTGKPSQNAQCLGLKITSKLVRISNELIAEMPQSGEAL